MGAKMALFKAHSLGELTGGWLLALPVARAPVARRALTSATWAVAQKVCELAVFSFGGANLGWQA